MEKNKIAFVGIYITLILYLSSCIQTERTYDIIGLPSKSEIWGSLKIALPFILVGLIISYLSFWKKRSNSELSSSTQNVGCFGMILIFIGGIFVMPLWAWIEYFFISAVKISLVFILIGILVFALYSKIKDK
ncbi:MAG: hypothetical protein Q8K92_13395 [Leadbetterella sp.]|nr:hypothetical protein [Leadbetterella sp.]